MPGLFTNTGAQSPIPYAESLKNTCGVFTVCLRNRALRTLIPQDASLWKSSRNEPVTLAPSLTSCRLLRTPFTWSFKWETIMSLVCSEVQKRCFECWSTVSGTQSCAVCVIKLVMIVTFRSLYWTSGRSQCFLVKLCISHHHKDVSHC